MHSGFAAFPVLSQNEGKNAQQSAYQYASEEQWIEVLFAGESKVRMLNGSLIDLKTRALQGVDEILVNMRVFPIIYFP